MALAHHAGAASAPSAQDVEIREIGLRDLRIALAQGWDDFMHKRGDLIFLGLIYPGAAVLAALIAVNASVLPLVVPIATGALLLGPAAASGFFELARRREQGLDSGWRHFFDAERGPARESLAALTAMVFCVFMLWLVAAWVVYLETMGAAAPASTGAFVHAMFSTRQGWEMVVIGNLVGVGFAILTLALTVVSFPMLVDGAASLRLALRTSLRVTAKNPVTFAVWGIIVVALVVLGSIPVFVGLGIVLPVLGYSTWHLYTRAVVRPHVSASR